MQSEITCPGHGHRNLVKAATFNLCCNTASCQTKSGLITTLKIGLRLKVKLKFLLCFSIRLSLCYRLTIFVSTLESTFSKGIVT